MNINALRRHVRCGFALAGLVLVTPAQADGRLYQWTDANGRVHFSDSAPAEGAAARTRAVGVAPALPRVNTYKPVSLPAGKLAPVAIALPDFSALQGPRELGRLYMAADCINPTVLGWKELQGPGSIFMEGNRRYLAESIAGVLKAQGYDAEVAASDDRWQQLAAEGALRLVPKVIAVDVRVCAPRHTSLQIRQNDIPRLVQVSGERAGSWMKLRWELWRKDGRFPLKVFETEGAFMQWQESTSLWNVMHESARQAARNLTGYPVLGKTLLLPAAPPVAAKATASDAASGLVGWVESLTARFTQQGRVANVMAIVSPFKVMVTNYYLEEGRWPTDITALEPDPARRRQVDMVDDVALGPDGEIIVSLSPKIHPRGYLRLKPSEGGMAINWACRSNLPAEALGGPDGFCTSETR